MDCSSIYKFYLERWLIEECFRFYKVANDLDDTKVHSSLSVMKNEFINFIATTITMSLKNKFDDTKLSDKHSYADVMDLLKHGLKAKDERTGEWKFCTEDIKLFTEILKTLELIPKDKKDETKEERAKKKIEAKKKRVQRELARKEALAKAPTSKGVGRHKMTRSISKKGCSPDNSACEGFFGRMKNEFYYGKIWTKVSLKEFIVLINNYIHWYNEKRIKVSLGCMFPTEYRQSLGIRI